MSEKVQKILARAGIGSRREVEKWIAEGRVSVNGSIIQLGERATAEDKIRVNGKIIRTRGTDNVKRRVLIYNKPEGEVCTRSDPEGRTTVFDRLPRINTGRWIVIGRLDINTTGLLMFTNDGELANRLMHPSYEIERKYAVRVLGEVTDEMKEQLLSGVDLLEGQAKFASLEDAGGEGANRWYHVVLKEGRNREVRRMFETQGLTVSRLIRICYGDLELPRELRMGRWEELEYRDVKRLMALVDLQEGDPVLRRAMRGRRKVPPKMRDKD